MSKLVEKSSFWLTRLDVIAVGDLFGKRMPASLSGEGAEQSDSI